MFDTLYQHIFTLPLPVAEKILRSIIVYVFLVVLLRVFGKRELAQLNPFDFVVLITLSNTVQNAIIGEDNSVTGGVIGAFTLVAINALVVKLVKKYEALDRIVEGEDSVLIDGGQINEEVLKRELLTVQDLRKVAREAGYESLEDIESCILEPTGKFSIVAKRPRPEGFGQDEILAALADLKQEIAAIRRA